MAITFNSSGPVSLGGKFLYPRTKLAGARVGSNGLFYGGSASGATCVCAGTGKNTVTRINACGALVGSQTTAGTGRCSLGGAAVGVNGLFYGGIGRVSVSSILYNIATRINACGALVGSETTAGTVRCSLGGAAVGSNGLFYGGTYCSSNLVTRINACGALVGSETNVGTGRSALAGAAVGSNGLFYGGRYQSGHSGCVYTNIATRINACGALVGGETNVGTCRSALAGAAVGSNGLFYGGSSNVLPTNIVTRIDSSGALVSNVSCATAGAPCNVGGFLSISGSIGFNCSAVRFLAGICSGTVGVSNFYGRTLNFGMFYSSATTARVGQCGSLIASCTTGVGTCRYGIAGAKVGSNGLYFGGRSCNKVTRINACGALVGSETTAGVVYINCTPGGAAVGVNGLFYAGSCAVAYVTRINACGALVGSQTTVGTARLLLAGALVGVNGLFYGGNGSGCAGKTVTRINACGALVGSQTTVGTSRYGLGGAAVGSNGLFYQGVGVVGGSAVIYNLVTRINACGALVGSETNVGNTGFYGTGAKVGVNGLFYNSGQVTRINSCGALVCSTTSMSSSIQLAGGAGFN